MFLLPGDSPMGLRLPLDALLWEPKGRRQTLHPRDPFAPKEVLPADFGEQLQPFVREKFAELWGAVQDGAPWPEE